MITALRTHLGTWFARILFGVLVVSFAAFGIGDVIRWFGAETWVAKVGPRTIEVPELQQAYQNQLSQIMRMLGGTVDPTVEMKKGIAARALENLINETALDQEMRKLRLRAPDDAVAQEVAGMAQFRGPDGQFNRAALQAGLRNAGLSEARFLELVRGNLSQRQLLGSLRAGITAPEALARPVFAFQNEKRAADLVELPFAAVTAPEVTEAQAQRYYDNNPDRYTTPEYRRIKVVILSPLSLSSEIQIVEDDIKAAYEARRASYVTPEKRSAEIIIIQDEAKASELVAQWRAGADWDAMQKAATEAGGSSVALNDVRVEEFPDPVLGAAVFAAEQGAISNPVKSALGWQLFRVTSVNAGNTRALDDVRDDLRAALLEEKAADIIHNRAAKVEDVLAAGTSLDDLPADLGLAAVTGTIDAQGNTMAHEPAPIPGGPELRQAVIAAAFDARPGDPPRLNEVRPSRQGGGGTSSYFALVLESVTPPGLRPFADIKETVMEDVAQAARRRMQEEAAAKLIAAVQGGQSLEDAATVAGATYTRTPLTGRAEPAAGVPRELVTPLFGMKKGEATMVETPEAFLVASPAEIQVPDPAADPAGYQRTREGLATALGNDVDAAFITGVRERAQPVVNRKVLDNFVQQ